MEINQKIKNQKSSKKKFLNNEKSKKNFFLFEKIFSKNEITNKEKEKIENEIEKINIREISFFINNLQFLEKKIIFDIVSKNFNSKEKRVEILFKNKNSIPNIIDNIEKEILKLRISKILNIILNDLILKIKSEKFTINKIFFQYSNDNIFIKANFRELFKDYIFYSFKIKDFNLDLNSDKEDFEKISKKINITSKNIENKFLILKEKEKTEYLNGNIEEPKDIYENKKSKIKKKKITFFRFLKMLNLKNKKNKNKKMKKQKKEKKQLDIEKIQEIGKSIDEISTELDKM